MEGIFTQRIVRRRRVGAREKKIAGAGRTKRDSYRVVWDEIGEGAVAVEWGIEGRR